MKLPFASVILLFGVLSVQAQQLTVKQSRWASIVASSDLAVNILEPEQMKADTPVPMVVYLQNLSTTRVGQRGDEPIVREFLGQGMLVVMIDYASHPGARVPFINRDIAKIRDELRAGQFLKEYKIDQAHVFIVPAGCRLVRDVVFYRHEERTLAMDIIYPAEPKQARGAVIEFSCDNANRMGNASLSICSDTALEGLATEGFAVAMADHPVPPPYNGLDPMPDCAWKIKAAVRTLRAKGAELGLNGKIAPLGFSRGSGMALMLVTTKGMDEFEGHGEFPGVSSAVQGGVIMSGRFTYLDLLPEDKMIPRYVKAWGERDANLDVWRRHGALDYLKQATVPLFLTINTTESNDAIYQMTVLRKRLADLDNGGTYMLDRDPRGHKVTLAPEILEAMSNYLKARLAQP